MFLASKVGPEAVHLDDELRLADEREGKADRHRFGLALWLNSEARFIILHALDHAPETLAPVYQLFQLYLGFVTRPQRKVARSHQWPVDTGRGTLEPILAGYRIIDVEHPGQPAADRGAVLDSHLSHWPLGHDLHRASIAPRNLDPHQPEAELLEHGLGEIGDHPGRSR